MSRCVSMRGRWSRRSRIWSGRTPSCGSFAKGRPSIRSSRSRPHRLCPPSPNSLITTPMKTGIVTIVGRPNVGKSTLLNAILKEKIAIVSDKPQTTRTRILGVAHLPGAQILFLDTPGLHQPQHQLNKRMVRTAIDAIHEADLLYVMVDATAWQPTAGDRAAFKQIASEL